MNSIIEHAEDDDDDYGQSKGDGKLRPLTFCELLQKWTNDFGFLEIIDLLLKETNF